MLSTRGTSGLRLARGIARNHVAPEDGARCPCAARRNAALAQSTANARVPIKIRTPTFAGIARENEPRTVRIPSRYCTPHQHTQQMHATSSALATNANRAATMGFFTGNGCIEDAIAPGCARSHPTGPRPKHFVRTLKINALLDTYEIRDIFPNPATKWGCDDWNRFLAGLDLRCGIRDSLDRASRLWRISAMQKRFATIPVRHRLCALV